METLSLVYPLTHKYLENSTLVMRKYFVVAILEEKSSVLVIIWKKLYT